jgi:hypothetical protein
MTDLRDRIAADYDIEGIAAETLVDSIVRTVEELALLEAALEEHGPLITGARGHLVANPALQAITRHRALLAKLVKEAFPGEHESVSAQASRAARIRWAAVREGRTA